MTCILPFEVVTSNFRLAREYSRLRKESIYSPVLGILSTRDLVRPLTGHSRFHSVFVTTFPICTPCSNCNSLRRATESPPNHFRQSHSGPCSYTLTLTCFSAFRHCFALIAVFIHLLMCSEGPSGRQDGRLRPHQAARGEKTAYLRQSDATYGRVYPPLGGCFVAGGPCPAPGPHPDSVQKMTRSSLRRPKSTTALRLLLLCSHSSNHRHNKSISTLRHPPPLLRGGGKYLIVIPDVRATAT
jgi:hypothetical protein